MARGTLAGATAGAVGAVGLSSVSAAEPMASSLSVAASTAPRRRPQPAAAEALALQQNLVEAAMSCDAAKRSLHQFARTTDFYRKQLSSFMAVQGTGLTWLDESRMQEIRDVVQAFASEVRNLAAKRENAEVERSAGGSNRQSYEVLRQSLEEAHNRCESLNCDLVHQTDANEELVEALGTVKDANKRLLEQIRYQTSEIAQLTTQRVTDEERLDQLTRAHQNDRDLFRQDTQRQILEIRERGVEGFELGRRRAASTMECFRTRVQTVIQQSGKLLEEQRKIRREAAAMLDAAREQIKIVEREASAKCAQHAEAHEKRCVARRAAVAELEASALLERDVRSSEALSWSHRHGVLSADMEDVQARMGRDISQLHAQQHAMERGLAAERNAQEEERRQLEDEVAAATTSNLSKRAQLEALQRRLAELERASCDDDLLTREEANADLRRKLRESDDALAAAVTGNEHLRAQMEEQRVRFQEKNESDVADYRAAFELRLANAHSAHDVTLAAAGDQASAIEVELAREGQAADADRAQAAGIVAENEALRRDLAALRSAHDAESAARVQLERDHEECQHTFASERLRLQASCDRMVPAIASIEDSSSKLEDEIDHWRRAGAAAATSHETRQSAAVLALRDTEDSCDTLRRRLADLEEAKARVDAESESSKRRALEVQASLEASLQTRKRELQEERERFERGLDSELRVREQSREELDREREAGTVMLQRAQEESRGRIDALQREKTRLAERARSEITDASEALAKQQKKVDALDQDVSRVRCLLRESESNLTWVRAELERSEVELNVQRRALEDETHATQGLLDRTLREDASLARQIEDANRRIEHDKSCLARELGGVQRATAVERVEVDKRCDLETEFSRFGRGRSGGGGGQGGVTLPDESAVDRSYSSSVGVSASGFLNASSSAVAEPSGGGFAFSGGGGSLGASRDVGISALHSKLESHIARLQRHTDALRGNLHAAPSASRLPPELPTFSGSFTAGTRGGAGERAASSPAVRGSGGACGAERSGAPVDAAFDAADVNHDGVLSRDEFRRAFTVQGSGARALSTAATL
eukprot:TRINITY_DN63812_c0_g1_i1.p1 TRINITY_DN63812_c0_g1~~TRINITY_DN63812_c0_g1_i1.p1  ORF type:complete len:1066 (+),score=242.30 TRINITY_DN63812_c0_g1_i1:80-3277(+)